jgi:hypothetical protein
VLAAVAHDDDQRPGGSLLAHDTLQLFAARGIEAGPRLVEQEHARRVDQGARQGYALLLASGQGAYGAVGQALRADACSDPIPRSSRLDAVEAGCELDVLARGELAVAVRSVGHPSEVRAHPLVVGPEGGVRDAPDSGPKHRTDHGEERALARAVGPFQKCDRSRFERAGYPAQRGRSPEQARYPPNLDALDPLHRHSIPRQEGACRGAFPPYGPLQAFV